MRCLSLFAVGVLLLPPLLQEHPFAAVAEDDSIRRSTSSQEISDAYPDGGEGLREAELRELLRQSKEALISRLRESPEDDLAERALSAIIEVEWKEKTPAEFSTSLGAAATSSRDPMLRSLSEKISRIVRFH